MFNNDFTLMLPVSRQNISLANECISHLLDCCDLPIVVIDENGQDSDYISNIRIKYVHTLSSRRPSLTRIWNRCITECPTEYPITVAWRCRPTYDDLKLMDDKISQGFGLVALQDLHFFCYGKHLTTTLGWHDTGFTDGQWEDCDIWNRFFVNDVAIFASHQVKEVSYPTCWPNGYINERYYRQKWDDSKPPRLIQLKLEENVEDRKIYQSIYRDRQYLPFKESELLAPNLVNYFKTYCER